MAPTATLKAAPPSSPSRAASPVVDLRERLAARDPKRVIEVLLPEGPIHFLPITLQVIDDLTSDRVMQAIAELVPDEAELALLKKYTVDDLGFILTETFPDQLGKRSA